MTSQHLVLAVETVRKAIMGAQIAGEPSALVSYGGVPQECLAAILEVEGQQEEFRRLFWQRVALIPNVKEFFGNLIRVRLRQNDVLASPLISLAFDDRPPVEERLRIIRGLAGVEAIREDYRPNEDPNQGQHTDDLARDMLAEILVLYMLVQLGFADIEKVIGDGSQPRVDILACKDNREYAIEVTRRKEVASWATLPHSNLEDCSNPDNRATIGKVLGRILADKNEQLERALNLGTVHEPAIKTVAMKTSDYGMSECTDEVEQIARSLLADGNNYKRVDVLWLIPNVSVSESRWISRT